MTSINKKCNCHATFQYSSIPQNHTEKLAKLLCNISEGFLNPGPQVAWVTKYCMVAPYICGSSVWNLLYVTLLMHRILRWLPFFRKISINLVCLDRLWFVLLKEWSFEQNDEHFLNLILTSIMTLIYNSNYLLTRSYVMMSLEILVWQHAGTFGSSCSFRPSSLLTCKGKLSLLRYLYSL